jgi:pimeloyl-ACP methyl ester carboxylesterase
MDTTTLNSTPAAPPPPRTTIVLIPGHWLGGWAWEDVAGDLRGRGFDVVAVTLPGLESGDAHRGSTTLADQVTHLRGVTDQAAANGSSVVLVAHSGANYPVSVLLDERPTAIRRVIYVDSGPSSDGAAFADSLPAEQDQVPLPAFDQMAASLDGLSDADLARFRERAVPQPGSVLREHVDLVNDARRDVPATIIACSYPAEVMMQMARDGHPMMAEVTTLRDLDLIDLPTGHWPMWSRPTDLAAAIAAAASH